MEGLDKKKDALHLSSKGKIVNTPKRKVEEDTVKEKRRYLLDSVMEGGYEDLLSMASFIILPYLAGLFFIFIVVAGLNPTIFMYVLDINASFATWAIGYEILGLLAIVWLVKLLIASYVKAKEYNQTYKQFKAH